MVDASSVVAALLNHIEAKVLEALHTASYQDCPWSKDKVLGLAEKDKGGGSCSIAPDVQVAISVPDTALADCPLPLKDSIRNHVNSLLHRLPVLDSERKNQARSLYSPSGPPHFTLKIVFGDAETTPDPSTLKKQDGRKRRRVTHKRASPSFIDLPTPVSAESLLPLCRVVLHRADVVLEGRYRKLRRDLSQTPWFLEDEDGEGSRSVRGSVEKVVGEIAQQFWDCSGFAFHAAGREDIDVRMLGSGRPFLLTLKNPMRLYPVLNGRTLETVEDIGRCVNEWTQPRGVEIIRLTPTAKTADQFRQMQLLAEQKRKEYCCVCWMRSRDITEFDIQSLNALLSTSSNGDDVNQYVVRLPSSRSTGNCLLMDESSEATAAEESTALRVTQKTPIRVAHRRSMAAREKFVHSLEARKLSSPRHFALRLVTDAGTYIKEFVHGDLGRTVPSITGLLGTTVDLVQLDVLDLHLDDLPNLAPPMAA